MSSIFNDISDALQECDEEKVRELVGKALADGVSARDILAHGLLSGMSVIADQFKNHEIFVPEVLMAAQAMNDGAALLKPHLADGDASPAGTALLGTVRGDLHDIGKNLARMMFEAKGFRIIDLGVDVSPEKFLEAYHAEKPDVVAMSALLTTTIGEMKNTVDVFVEAGLRDKVTIIIGGAPVTETFREFAGADLYAADAATGAEAAQKAVLAKSATGQ